MLLHSGELHRPDSELASLGYELLDRGDAATFAFRVSKLGWRTTIKEYSTGRHTPLPAPLSAMPTLRLQLSKPPVQSSDRAPPTSFRLFLGNLPPAGIELADVMDLCRSSLGHLPLDVRFETTLGTADDGGKRRLASVEVATDREQRILMEEVKKKWLSGSRVSVGLKLEDVTGKG
jgi:hypothetical protein